MDRGGGAVALAAGLLPALSLASRPGCLGHNAGVPALGGEHMPLEGYQE